MRKGTKKMSKALSLLLSLSLLGSVLFPVAPARAEGEDVLVDDFDASQVADEVTGNFEKWPAETSNTGTTIWGNANGAAGSSVVYESQAGKRFESLALTVDYHADWSTDLACVTVEAKTKDGTDWEGLALEKGEALELKNSYQQVEMTASLPDNTVSVRVTMTNGVTWTLWLDRLELSMADLPTEPDPDPTPTPTPTPTAEPEENQSTDSLLVDNFVTTVTVASEVTGTFEKHNPHAEAGTGVWGNAAGPGSGTLTYVAEEGKCFETFALTLEYFNGFEGTLGYVVVETKTKTSTDWVTLPTEKGAALALNDKFWQVKMTASLPEETVQVRISITQPTSYTLWLDRLEMPIGDLPTEPDPGPDPGVTTDHGTYTETRTTFTFNGREFDYSLAQPKEGQPKTAILYLHGLGGDTDFTIYENFLKAVYDTYQGNCIVVAPFANAPFDDATKNDYWIDYAAVYENPIDGRCSTYTQANYAQTAAEQFALALFQDVCQRYTLDKKYIVGYSMGAYGTWDIITRHPTLFDAAVPISGGSDPSLASKLTALPIWAFHGNADAVVDYHGTLNMVEAIRALEGQKLRYTEYENGDHGICYEAFKVALPWLFQGAPDPEPGTDPDPTPEAEPEENQSTDSLLVDNFVTTVTVGTVESGAFQSFNPHDETHTGVWGQKNHNSRSSVVYTAPEGKCFTSLSLTVDYFHGYVDPGRSLQAEAQVNGGEDWTQVALTAGEPKLLTTSGDKTINLQTFTADLPKNTVSVRVTMSNDVNYTLFLDRLEMPIAALEQETAPRPGAAAESPLVDDFLSVGKASETEGEFSQFDPHPDTGTSVWGQAANNSKSSLIYRVAEEETYFRDLALTVNYFDGYLQPASSLRVEVRKDGDTSWNAVSLSGGPSSHLATTTGGLEVKKMTFSAQLPWGSKEVKVTMLNDVAWTLFLDRLEMNLGETSREVPFEGLAIGDLAAEREGTFAWGTIPAEGGTVRTAVCTDGENGKGALIYNAGNDRDSISGVTLRTYRRDGTDPAEIFTVLAQTKGSTAFREIPAVTGTTRNARRSQLLNVATSELSPCVLHYTPPENTVSVKVIVPVAGEEAEDAAYLTGISLAMSAQTQTQPSDGGGSSSSSQGKGSSAVKEQEKEAAGWTGERLTDEFAQDKQVANEVAGEFSQFDPHPDTGTSVWGLTNNYTQGSLTYHAKEGRVFSDISLTVNYFVGYVDLATALAVEVQGNDEKTWHPVSLETREEKLLNTTSGGLELNTLTYGARLPKGAAKLRITMRNDVAWTVFLDRLELNTVEPSAQTDAPAPAEPLPSEETPKPVEDLPTEPEPAASTVGVMTDELTDFSKMAAHTENLQLFEAHPETGGSVIGRLDTASESSMTYAAPEGAYIQALLLGTQYYPEFVDFSRDISVMVLQEGKTNWRKASFTAGQARDIPGFESGAFKNNELTVQIPDRVVKARIELLNDVAWTVFLDRVALTTGVEETVPASLKTEPAKQPVEKAAGTAAKAPVETAPVETTGEPPAETLTESPEKTPAEAPTEAPTEAPQEPAEAVEEVPTEEVPLASGAEAWQNNVLWWVAALVVLAASGTLVYMDRRKKRGES